MKTNNLAFENCSNDLSCCRVEARAVFPHGCIWGFQEAMKTTTLNQPRAMTYDTNPNYVVGGFTPSEKILVKMGIFLK